MVVEQWGKGGGGRCTGRGRKWGSEGNGRERKVKRMVMVACEQL